LDWNPIALAERGLLPDGLARVGIRRLIARRLREETAPDCEAAAERLAEFEAMQRAGPVAVATADANAQHYEVPTGFFRRVLGPRLKYSACLFSPGVTALGEAEEAMLALTCERAGVADGMGILELGCGWGSLGLWMAERYPAARIVAVSNSATQRAFIEERAREQGLANLRVITRDMNEFDTEERFDRVVSVEMLEHMRNHPLLFERIAGWLRPGGRLFFHIFCHRRLAYLFGRHGEDTGWVATSSPAG
jgi:cyclopropane-fatty-acyl-phospholipid synthase